MAFKKLLVAFDDSDYSKRALKAALDMVDQCSLTKVIVLFVTESYQGADTAVENEAKMSGVSIITLSEIEREELEEKIAPIIKGYEESFEAIVRIGVAKQEILQAAEENHCDIIIMGTRGLGALRGMIGSVSYAVLRDSSVPVLLTK
jgi:nucleotide-binding universal stress UspA family protein